MFYFLIFFHLLICIALVGVVLMQSGKGGGLAGGAFGGSAQTVFGGRGATDFLTKATMVLGGAFFLSSLVLALMTSGFTAGPRSLIQQEARRAAGSQPAQLPTRGGAPAQQAPAAPAGGQQAPATPSGGQQTPSGGR